MPPHLKTDPRLQFRFLTGGFRAEELLPDPGRFRKCLSIALSGGGDLHAGLYERVCRALDGRISLFWRNRATIQAMGRLWTRNLVANASRIRDSLPLAELKERAAGRALAVAGAGPSLERALEFFKAERGGLYLVAVDTALPSLRAAGISPDAAVCLEAQVHNVKDFIGAGRDFCLIADIASHPAALREAGGELALVSTRFAPLKIFDRMEAAGIMPEPLPALGSVGVAAARIGLALRDPGYPLLVTGLDFSFRRGESHARGSPARIGFFAARDRLSADPAWTAAMRPGCLKVEGRPGLYSDPALSGYAELFKDEAGAFKEAIRDIRCGGLDLGLAEWKPEAAALSGLGRAIGALPLRGFGQGPDSLARACADFLARELESLRRLRACLSGDARPQEGEVEELLKASDYLYLHYPDAPRGPRMERDFLARVAIEADSFIPRFERSAARAGAGAKKA
jgi:hypothetical protein